MGHISMGVDISSDTGAPSKAGARGPAAPPGSPLATPLGDAKAGLKLYRPYQTLKLRITMASYKELEIAQSEQDVSPFCKESDMTYS